MPVKSSMNWRMGLVLALAMAWAGTISAFAQYDPRARADSSSSHPAFTDPRQPVQASPFSRVILRAVRDRWRMLDGYGIQVPRGSIFDPYNQNLLKGDFPAFGQNTFMAITIVGTPAAIFTNLENVDTQFNNKLIPSVEIFHGATVFSPKDWSLKASGQGVFNRGNNKDLDDFDALELFGELKLFEVGRNYDFTSVRAGLQPFTSDFNGLVFKDINLGAQLFGELSRNRYRWSLAYFSQRRKENGQLSFDALEQEVFVANWFSEDFLRPGFNSVFSLHYNRDRSSKAGNDLDVYYAGFASDGHWGRIEFNPAFYYAFGKEKLNPIARQETSVSAFLAGVELAYQKNYRRYRAAYFMASGDSEPGDDRAKGFDSINDNLNLFGGAISFGLGNGAFFMRPNSLLPANRAEGIANFVNPGIQVINVGYDLVFTPKLFFEFNYNNLRFLNTASIRKNDQEVSTALGFEINAGFTYRLFLNENLVFKIGGAAFFPQDGGKQLLGSEATVFAGNVALVLLY